MVQEVVTRSWGSRIISALWGTVVGIALIIGAFVLVFWNESHGLHTAQSLSQTQQVLIPVANSPIDAKNDLKVVYFKGMAATSDILTDNLLGVSENAIQLRRHVEMYQWREHQESKTDNQTGGSQQETITYSYEKVWSPELIDSSEFKDPEGHQNPKTMRVMSKNHYAKTVTVGDFNLPTELITKIDNATPVDLDHADVANLKAQLGKEITHVQGDLYAGANQESPEIGDYRISVTEVLPQTVSVIGQQTGTTLQAYLPPAGEPIILINSGEHSAAEMIQIAISENSMLTWILRGVSLLMMIIGLGLLMQPVVILADFIPFLGSIAGFGTGVIAFAGGIVLWAAATAIAWFAVRPMLAIGLIVGAVAVAYIIIPRKKKTSP